MSPWPWTSSSPQAPGIVGKWLRTDDFEYLKMRHAHVLPRESTYTQPFDEHTSQLLWFKDDARLDWVQLDLHDLFYRNGQFGYFDDTEHGTIQSFALMPEVRSCFTIDKILERVRLRCRGCLSPELAPWSYFVNAPSNHEKALWRNDDGNFVDGFSYWLCKTNWYLLRDQASRAPASPSKKPYNCMTTVVNHTRNKHREIPSWLRAFWWHKEMQEVPGICREFDRWMRENGLISAHRAVINNDLTEALWHPILDQLLRKQVKKNY